MKVQVQIEFEVEPLEEVNAKGFQSLTASLVRLVRNRMNGYLGAVVGGNHAKTGWEATVKEITVVPQPKSRG